MSDERERAARERAKMAILRLIRNEGANGFHGKTRLNKGFHAAHVFYMRETGLDLTGWAIVHLPEGPAIDRLDGLLGDLVQEKRLLVSYVPDGPYQKAVYRLGTAIPVELDDEGYEAGEALASATQYIAGKTAAELSQESHENSRAWQQTKDGEVMDLVLDVVTDDDLEAARAAREASDRGLAGLFGD